MLLVTLATEKNNNRQMRFALRSASRLVFDQNNLANSQRFGDVYVKIACKYAIITYSLLGKIKDFAAQQCPFGFLIFIAISFHGM